VSSTRLLVCAVLIAATALVARAAQSSVATTAKLDAVPLAIGGWQGVVASPLDREVVRELGADAYINRTYRQAGAPPLGLYVAYYTSQRPGASIHSPLNCLPGTGWEPVSVDTLRVAMPNGASGAVRQMLVQKREERALVLYWYQVHGRMIASELASRGYLIADTIATHRTDAALVRVVVPVTGSGREAERQGAAFVRALLPALDRVWG
jgi:EpsI family protein